MRFLFLLFLCSACFAGETLKKTVPLKIAVVDSGLDITDSRLKGHLCQSGHKDFTGNGLRDVVNHGTFVTGLIEKYAGNGNYCLLIYKYYSASESGEKNLNNEIASFKEAIKNGAKIINFSAGGLEYSRDEFLIIKNNPSITFVIAAGNEGKNLDVRGNEYYPASYFLPNEIIVKSISVTNKKPDAYMWSYIDKKSLIEETDLSSFTNWSSKITESEIGEDIYSTLPNGKYGYLSGTSFSTAIRTGKIVRKMLDAK